MKRLIILCLFLTACASKPITRQEPICNYLFNSWEAAKEAGAKGIFFQIGETEGVIFLLNSSAGLHELGHFVDRERGMASQTQEFEDAVNEFLATPSDLREAFVVWLTPEKRMHEIYAELYKISLIAELPAIFEEFFK